MKAKKSIRKLGSPLARDLARLSRDLHTIRRRIDTLTDKVEDQAFQLRAAHKELNAIHGGKMMKEQTAIDAARSIEPLFSEEYPE